MKAAIFVLFLSLFALFYAGSARASGGSIHGVVKNGETPIAGVTVRLLELDRYAQSNERGEFLFTNVPSGSYKLFVRLVGFASMTNTVEVGSGTTETAFALMESAVQGEEVVVTSTTNAGPAQEQYQSVDSKSRIELHQSAGQSFAEQIGDLPGVDVRYNGAAPSRPILRGLSDNEVLILENGLRTGDLSTFDPAHAVPIEAEAVSEIEIVRGPSSLMFGSNAIGGLVNVITNTIPTAAADGVSGRISATGNSVSNLYSGYFNTVYSTGGHAFSISAGGSHSDAIRIPDATYTDPGTGFHYQLDTIPQSFAHSSEEGAGYSYQGSFGTIGIGAKHYKMNYGIPGAPAVSDVTMPPASSRIIQEKYAVELRGLFDLDGSFIRQIRLNSNVVDYLHSERPTMQDTGNGNVFDAEQNNFHQNGYNTTLQFVQARMGNVQGTIGLFANIDNLTIGGPQPLGPNSLTTNLAGYLFEEYLAGENTRLQAGVRYDFNKIQTNPSPGSAVAAFQTFDTSRLANAVTGSLGIIQKLGNGLTASISAARSYRAPTVQELFGHGPDDASKSFIVGTASLVPETALGIDAILRSEFDGFSFSVNPYINFITNYIYSYFPGPTDTTATPRYPIRNFAQTDARLMGVEVSTTVQLLTHFSVSANMSYVRADAVRDTTKPLPFIPAMKGLVRFNYQDNTYGALLEWRLTNSQNRIGIGETSTAGYGVVNLGASMRIPMGSAVHQVSLHCDNLLNQKYFDHISVIKGFLPQPARGFRLAYDLLF
jgi:iron complex outermembrane receptor protein